MEPAREVADYEMVLQNWQSASAHLESLDREIRDLRAALEEKMSGRPAVVAREVALRQQLISLCPPEQEAPAELAGKTDGYANSRIVSRMDDDEDEDDEQSPSVSNNCHNAEDFYEDALDAVGVVRCGLCGLKFSISEAQKLEAHYATCAAENADAGLPVPMAHDDFKDAAKELVRGFAGVSTEGTKQLALDRFNVLPLKEQKAMLTLREKAKKNVGDMPGEIMESALLRIRSWGESVNWPNFKDLEKSPWGNNSPKWKLLGFQSSDPRTDFRTGTLALDNLVYLFEHHSAEAELMCVEACSESLSYPFAMASINLTQVLAWYLSLISGPNPIHHDTGTQPLDDPMQFHAFARLCTDTHAFSELHTVAMMRLHFELRQAKVGNPPATVASLGQSLQRTIGVVDKVLRDSGLENVVEFQRILTV